MEKKLYRSRSDRMISGVCGGLADYLALDPTLVRVGVVLLAVLTQFGIVIAYLVMSIVVPEEPDEQGGIAMSETDTQTVETTVPESQSPPAAPAASWAPTSAPAPEKPRRVRGSVGFGIVLVLVGVLLLVNEFVPNVDVWRFWPLIIVAIGLGAVYKGVRG